MSMEYSKIGDICLKVCSGGTPTSSNPNYYNGGIPWLNTNEVNFCNIDSTNKTISQEGLEHSAAKYIPANTVIVAMYGVTAGKSAIAKIPLTTNQACCNLVIDAAKADYRYVYYFLKQQSDNLNKLANGGAQQNLNSLIIKKYKIALPNLEVQHRIASILSTYDSLIENNTKRIRLLEKMAKNLYKEWFVRFRFPGHENVEMENGLPKGWKYYRIEDLCDINRETIKIANAPKDILYLDTGSVTRGKISDVESLTFADAPSRARRIVRNDSIIYSTVRPNLQHYGILKNPPSNLLVSTGFAVLDCKEEIANIVYLALSHPSVYRYCSLIADCAVATYPSIKPKEIGRIYIALPKMSVCKRWNEKIESYYKMINKLQHQNSLLARQRDLLLPRLMSGKLEVKEELLE